MDILFFIAVIIWVFGGGLMKSSRYALASPSSKLNPFNPNESDMKSVIWLAPWAAVPTDNLSFLNIPQKIPIQPLSLSLTG